MMFSVRTMLIVLAVGACGAVLGWLAGDVLAVALYDYRQTPAQAAFCAKITAVGGSIAALLFYVALHLLPWKPRQQ